MNMDDVTLAGLIAVIVFIIIVGAILLRGSGEGQVQVPFLKALIRKPSKSSVIVAREGGKVTGTKVTVEDGESIIVAEGGEVRDDDIKVGQ